MSKLRLEEFELFASDSSIEVSESEIHSVVSRKPDGSESANMQSNNFMTPPSFLRKISRRTP